VNPNVVESGDVELLALELETIWATDERGRLCGTPGAARSGAVLQHVDGQLGISGGRGEARPPLDRLDLEAFGGTGYLVTAGIR
jgi:hypothetical protein